jgi:hypothetical protein
VGESLLAEAAGAAAQYQGLHLLQNEYSDCRHALPELHFAIERCLKSAGSAKQPDSVDLLP